MTEQWQRLAVPVCMPVAQRTLSLSQWQPSRSLNMNLNLQVRPPRLVLQVASASEVRWAVNTYRVTAGAGAPANGSHSSVPGVAPRIAQASILLLARRAGLMTVARAQARAPRARITAKTRDGAGTTPIRILRDPASAIVITVHSTT